jgi:predicted  nucleic acid-binding Zn-ribbon protein
MMKKTLYEALKEREQELWERLEDVRKRKYALKEAIMKGVIADEKKRELAWERVEELHAEEVRLEDELDEVWQLMSELEAEMEVKSDGMDHGQKQANQSGSCS